MIPYDVALALEMMPGIAGSLALLYHKKGWYLLNMKKKIPFH